MELASLETEAEASEKERKKLYAELVTRKIGDGWKSYHGSWRRSKLMQYNPFDVCSSISLKTFYRHEFKQILIDFDALLFRVMTNPIRVKGNVLQFFMLVELEIAQFRKLAGIKPQSEDAFSATGSICLLIYQLNAREQTDLEAIFLRRLLLAYVESMQPSLPYVLIDSLASLSHASNQMIPTDDNNLSTTSSSSTSNVGKEVKSSTLKEPKSKKKVASISTSGLPIAFNGSFFGCLRSFACSSLLGFVVDLKCVDHIIMYNERLEFVHHGVEADSPAVFNKSKPIELEEILVTFLSQVSHSAIEATGIDSDNHVDMDRFDAILSSISRQQDRFLRVQLWLPVIVSLSHWKAQNGVDQIASDSSLREKESQIADSRSEQKTSADYRLAALLLFAVLSADCVSLDDRLYVSRRCFNNAPNSLEATWDVVFSSLASILPYSMEIRSSMDTLSCYPSCFSLPVKKHLTAIMDPFDSTVFQLYCALPTANVLDSIEEIIAKEFATIKFPFAPANILSDYDLDSQSSRIRLSKGAFKLPVFRKLLDSTLTDSSEAPVRLPESILGNFRQEDRFHYHSLRQLRENEGKTGGMDEIAREYLQLKPGVSSISIDAQPALYYFQRTSMELKIPKDIRQMLENLLSGGIPFSRLRKLARPVLMNHAEFVIKKIRESLSIVLETEVLLNCFRLLMLYLWPCDFHACSAIKKAYSELIDKIVAFLHGRGKLSDLHPEEQTFMKWRSSGEEKSGEKFLRYAYYLLTDQPETIIWSTDKYYELFQRLENHEDIPSLFGFPADVWQCTVLECCPPKPPQSCLICAPTSAGKTFLAREIMRRFVCEVQDGLVVYLCPTKALAAMVFRDLTENLHSKEGLEKKPVVGIFTKDLRVRHADADTKILVIIPELLEILILGPFGDKVRGRISCLIIDEAHYLGDINRGPVMERFFSMIEAPFYAFSATLEAAHTFLDWIRPVKPTVRLIPDVLQGEAKITRSTDLAYYVYDSSSSLMSKKAMRKASNNVTVDFESDLGKYCFIQLHPYSLLEDENAILAKLKLLPDLLPKQLIETLKLLGVDGRRRIRQVLENLPKNERLNNSLLSDKMETDFSEFDLFTLLCKCCGVSSFPLLRKHVGLIDFKLRECILQIVNEERELLISTQIQFKPRDLFSDLFLTSLRVKNRSEFAKIESITAERSRIGSLNSENVENFAPNVLHVILELERRNMIPAMCFFFPLNDLEQVVVALLESSHELKDRNEKLESSIEHLTLFETRAKIERDTTSEIYVKVLDCLKRGWGIHHSGLPLSIRSLMEELFAAGALKVIFCTTTLSTGVHTPCKSVIIVRDHARYLSPVEFHQIVGRAGRRNNDSVGHVILMVVSLKRTRDLICTKFSELYGEMGLSFSFLLRCVAAIQGMNSNELYALQKKSWAAFELMLKRPFYLHVFGAERSLSGTDSGAIVKREDMDIGFKHYLNLIHLSLISLQKLCLLDEHFNPIDLYMIVSRISYIEPFNIALVSSIISQSIPLGFAQFDNFRLEPGYEFRGRKNKSSPQSFVPSQIRKPNLSCNPMKSELNTNDNVSTSSTYNPFFGLEIESPNLNTKKKSKKKPLRKGIPSTTNNKKVKNPVGNEKKTDSIDAEAMDMDKIVESDFLTCSTILRMLVDYVGSKVFWTGFHATKHSSYSEALTLLGKKKYGDLQALLSDVPTGFLLPVPPMVMTNLLQYNQVIVGVAKDFALSCAEPISYDEDQLRRQMLALSHARFQPNSLNKSILFASEASHLKTRKGMRKAGGRNEVENADAICYAARDKSEYENSLFSLPALFGPCRAVYDAERALEEDNLGLFFSSLNQNPMTDRLPLVNLESMKKKVFCTILTDLIYHPSLVAKDAELLFEKDEMYHKRQLREAWDLMMKVDAAVRLLLKQISENETTTVQNTSSTDLHSIKNSNLSSATTTTSNNRNENSAIPCKNDNRIAMTEYLELLSRSMNCLSQAYRLNQLYSAHPLFVLKQHSVLITDTLDSPSGTSSSEKQKPEKQVNEKLKKAVDNEFAEEEDESHAMNYLRLEKKAKSCRSNPQSLLEKLHFLVVPSPEEQKGRYQRREAPFWLKVNAFYSILDWMYNFDRWPIMFLDPEIRCFTHAWTISRPVVGHVSEEKNATKPDFHPIVVIISSNNSNLPVDVPSLLPFTRHGTFEKTPYRTSFMPLIVDLVNANYRVVMFSLPRKFEDVKKGAQALKFIKCTLERLTEFPIPNWSEKEIDCSAVRFVASGPQPIRILEGSMNFSKSYLGICTSAQFAKDLLHYKKSKLVFDDSTTPKNLFEKVRALYM